MKWMKMIKSWDREREKKEGYFWLKSKYANYVIVYLFPIIHYLYLKLINVQERVIMRLHKYFSPILVNLGHIHLVLLTYLLSARTWSLVLLIMRPWNWVENRYPESWLGLVYHLSSQYWLILAVFWFCSFSYLKNHFKKKN